MHRSMLVNVLSAILLLAAANTLTECAISLPLKDEYLMIPAKHVCECDPLIAKMASLLVRLEPDSSQDMAALAESRLRTATIVYERELYTMLIVLAQDDGVCDMPTIRTILDTYAMMLYEPAETKSRFDAYIEYLKTAGARKFRGCAAKVERESASSCFVVRHERQMDELFVSAIGGAKVGKVTDAELYELVRNFDITRDAFNVEAALQLTWAKFDDDLTAVNQHFEAICTRFRIEASDQLQTLTLAESMGGYRTTDVRLLKLNEYMRNCLSLKRALDQAELDRKSQKEHRLKNWCGLLKRPKETVNRANRKTQINMYGVPAL